MKKILTSCLLILMIAFCSCKKCPCSPGLVHYNFIGFTEAEADTFIVRKFEPNGSFNIKKDTFLINNVVYKRSNDTLNMVAYPGAATFESRSDYEIFFPASNSLYRITEINEQSTNQSCGFLSTSKEGCINPINSLRINGTLMDLHPFRDFYIRK